MEKKVESTVLEKVISGLYRENGKTWKLLCRGLFWSFP